MGKGKFTVKWTNVADGESGYRGEFDTREQALGYISRRSPEKHITYAVCTGTPKKPGLALTAPKEGTELRDLIAQLDESLWGKVKSAFRRKQRRSVRAPARRKPSLWTPGRSREIARNTR